MSKRILALDIATNTGFAVDPPEGSQRRDKPICGSFRVSHSGDNLGQAYLEFKKRASELAVLHDVQVLAFEAPLPRGGKGNIGHSSVASVRKLIGLASIAELVAEELGLRAVEAFHQSARGHFIHGYGRKDQKAQVFRLAWTLGWNPPDEDAADACALWSYAHAIVNPRVPLYGAMPLFKSPPTARRA